MEHFNEYLKAPSITDWIQAGCALIFGIFAVIAFFKWKSQRHYDITMDALSFAGRASRLTKHYLLNDHLHVKTIVDEYEKFKDIADLFSFDDSQKDKFKKIYKFGFFWEVLLKSNQNDIDKISHINDQIQFFTRDEEDLREFYKSINEIIDYYKDVNYSYQHILFSYSKLTTLSINNNDFNKLKKKFINGFNMDNTINKLDFESTSKKIEELYKRICENKSNYTF